MIVALLKYFLVPTALCMTVVYNASAAVILNSSRVIYESTKSETSVMVSNNDKKRAFLIQSWVDNESESNKDKVPFVITPPLFRLDPEQEGMLRIVLTDEKLPSDRESIFWLNVKSIPSVEKNESNLLFLSINNRVKLFYRPYGLSGNSAEAYKKLDIIQKGNLLHLRNPTPYYISLRNLRIGTMEVKDPIMVPPKGELTHELKSGVSGKISWSAINDFGGTTPPTSN